MKRLVVVSNRVVPVKSNKVMAGGLAAGLLAALRDTGGIWFGWNGATSEASSRELEEITHEGITYLTTDLSVADHDGYYNGFSNRALWPLFHYRLDLTTFDRAWYEAYLRVNRQFAEQLLPYLKPGDVVWVHDYHLIPLGRELRRLGVTCPIGYFHHTPFAPPDLLVALPCHEPLFQGLFHYDLVGFQTRNDVRNFRDYVERELEGTIDSAGFATAGGQRLRSGAFPIGIDADDFARLADTVEGRRHRYRLVRSLAGRQSIIGADRADYSKGLRPRLEAFERLLEQYPKHRGHVHLLQITPPSREAVPEYAELEREIELVSGRINGRFAEYDWVPIRYIQKGYHRRILAAFFRASKVGLVTPLRDGMNLVAKEYVAAQDPLDPGALVLSQFAGAAKQLDQAILVNPYDIDGVAAAIHAALEMPLEERQARWREMMDGLRNEDIDRWRQSFLGALVSSYDRERLTLTARADAGGDVGLANPTSDVA